MAIHKKSNSSNKTKKNMKGGTPTQEQVLRILSILLALSSMGYLVWCTVEPVVTRLLECLELMGVNSITLSFYTILRDNLSSTWQSMSATIGKTAEAALSTLQTLSNAGNACAIGHAGIRLANPLYHFFLDFIKQIISTMQNPLSFNTNIQNVAGNIQTILMTFVGDYGKIGELAIKGADQTAALIGKLYKDLNIFFIKTKDTVIEKMPAQSIEEKEAQKKNMKIFESYVSMINSILTMAVSTASKAASVTKSSVNKTMDWCSMDPQEYAKSFMNFFGNMVKKEKKEGVAIDMSALITPAARKLAASPPPSSSPKPAVLRSFSEAMIAEPEEKTSGLRSRTRTGSATPLELKINPVMPAVETCSRAQSAPPFINRQPSVHHAARKLSPIREQSPWPVDKSPSPEPKPSKVKKEGGGRKRSRRHTQKHPRYRKRRTARMVRRRS